MKSSTQTFNTQSRDLNSILVSLCMIIHAIVF